MTALAKKVAELFGKPETDKKTLSTEVAPRPSTNNPPSTIYQETVNATPPSNALAVFPDWQGLLIKSKVLDISVWVVRNHLDGIALAKETGHPAVLLDDVIQQKGKTPAEARAALLPALITLEQ
jgi:hypothetical protein